MATFKAEVQNKRADGTYNVRIRVTHNRQVRRLSTNIYAKQGDLTKGLNIKNPEIINASNKLISDCITICNELSFRIVAMEIDELVEILKRKLKGEDKFKLDFIKFANDEIVKMKQSTAAFYVAAINALIRFINQESIDISKIDTEFLRKFKSFIEAEPSQRGSNRKTTTKKAEQTSKGRAVSAYLTCIRSIYNRARDKYNDEDRGIVNIPYYPFKKISIKQEQLTRKRALSIEQIQSIINLQYEPEIVGGRWSRFNLAKDCFLISFGLIGMNSTDLYHCKPAKNGIITYNRQKTKDRRDDKAEMKVRIEDCIKSLVNKYKGNEQLFTFYRHYADTQNFNRAINTGLKQIGKRLGIDDLEYYAARHSWATIARSAAVGIDKATVHEALNHVDDKMKVTDIYIDRDWTVIWEANRRVLELFDWNAIKMTM